MTLLETTIARRKGRRKEQQIAERLLDHVTFEFKMMRKGDLIIPITEYQRDESDGLIAKDIALHYNKVAFGALTVIRRENGEHVVADGGTRLSASLLRGDLELLPCLIFSGLTSEQEADVFLAINQNRRKLRIDQLQHSEVFAGRELALKVEAILETFREYRIGFDSLAALRGCVKKYPVATATIIRLSPEFAKDKHLSARVFKGLVFLENHLRKHERTLDERRRIMKLQAKFGILEATVNAALGSQNIRGTDSATCARAIAAAIGINFPRERRN